MFYIVPVYCFITAITVVLAAIHMKLLFAAYVAGTALFAVAAGDELRGIMSRGNIVNKLVRSILAVLILMLALWLGARCSINLYVRHVDGALWALLGAALGFFANQQYVAMPKRRR